MDQFFNVTRFTYDFGTQATSPIVAGSGWSLAAVSPGQAMNVYADGTRALHADLWFPDGGVTATGLTAPGAWDMAVASNGNGAAVAKWSHITGTNVDYVGAAGSPAGGGSWQGTGTTDSGVGYSTDRASLVALSNGDAVVVFNGGSLRATVFHAATGTFGPITTLDPNPSTLQDDAQDHWLVVDSHDRVTVGWWEDGGANGHLFTSRSLDGGGTWSTPVDLGQGESIRFAVDPVSERVALMTDGDFLTDAMTDHGYGLRVAGATDTTWSTMFTTPLSSTYIGYIVPIAFTSKGLRILSTVQNPDGGTESVLQTTVCN
jgi:hypothetical protein